MENEMENVQLLNLDLKLSDDTEELKHADDVLIKIRKQFELTVRARDINNKTHEEYYEATAKVLDYVGRLSIPIFNKFEYMENQYFLAYRKAPELAKQLWLTHYGNIHKPYNLIKNRCFRLLDEIDDEYIKQYKKMPPNWNP